MKMIIGLAVLSVVAPSQAQVPRRGPAQDALNNLLNPIRWAPMETLEVSGVRLYMTPAETRAALIAKGFTPRAADPDQPSWTALVSEKTVARGRGTADRSKVPMFTMASGSQGERIEVWYAATSEGPRATSVKYSIPANRMDAQSFLTGIETKYGRASFEQPKKRVYCTKGRDSRASCMQLGDVVDRPALIATADFAMHTVSLMEGSGPRNERKQVLAAEVEAKAPKNAAATF